MPATPCEMRMIATVKSTPISSQRILGTLMPLSTLLLRENSNTKTAMTRQTNGTTHQENNTNNSSCSFRRSVPGSPILLRYLLWLIQTVTQKEPQRRQQVTVGEEEPPPKMCIERPRTRFLQRTQVLLWRCKENHRLVALFKRLCS